MFLPPAPSLLQISAYADNWSWTTDNSLIHTGLLKRTEVATDAARLAIGFARTWWVSPLANPNAISQALPEAIPGPERVETPACSTKEVMVQMNVFPAAFHGVEIRPPSCAGTRLFQGCFCPLWCFYLSVPCSRLVYLYHFGSGISGYLASVVGCPCVYDSVSGLLLASLLSPCFSDRWFPAICHWSSICLGICPRSLGWQLDASGVLHADALREFFSCSQKSEKDTTFSGRNMDGPLSSSTQSETQLVSSFSGHLSLDHTTGT